MDKKVLLFIIVVAINLSVNGQRWRSYRWDVIGGLGTSTFFGDLGGGAGVPSHFVSFRDWDLSMTRPSIHAAIRCKVKERVSVKTNIYAGIISGDDAQSADWRRKTRNLNFRSPIIEGSMQLEFSFLRERFGSRYAIRKADFIDLLNGYVFFGGGVCYFDPSTFYERTWYKLQPMGTEGQGIALNDPKYSKVTACFPLGIGFKYTVTKFWAVGFEASVKYTLSDYLDDVGGSYYNFRQELKEGNITMEDLYDPIVIDLADRHRNEDGSAAEPYVTGTNIRSGAYTDYNDAYMFMTIYVAKKLVSGRRGLPKY